MYPRNAASPPRISVGPVVLIADGTVQTTGISVSVTPQGGAAGAGGGTPLDVQGIYHYTPTKAETNYIAFTVTAYKTGCIPVSITVVTTATPTAGEVKLAAAQAYNNTGQTAILPAGVVAWGGTVFVGAEMIEADSGTNRWTTKALEQGPIGSGGDATQTKQDEIIAELALIEGIGFVTGDDALSIISGKIDLISGTAGAGSITWTIMVEDNSNNPIAEVRVWVSTDVAGDNVVAGALRTDDFGNATFYLDAGTYYLWRDHASYNFTNPNTMIVA